MIPLWIVRPLQTALAAKQSGLFFLFYHENMNISIKFTFER